MVNATSDYEQIAESTLKEHGLLTVPVDPIALAANLDIRVLNAVFSDDSVVAMLSRRAESLSILVNANDPPYRKKFSIAHELAHHLLHDSVDEVDTVDNLFRTTEKGTPNEYEIREVQANRLAAALIMPRSLVIEKWRREKDLKKLARLFNVSVEAMVIRAETLDLI